MPRVPRAELSVDRAPLPAATQQSSAGPELFTAGQRQVAQFQGAVDRAADAGDRVLSNMQDREDADALFRAEARRDEMYLGFENAAKQRLGKDAEGLTEKTHEFFEKIGPEIGETLSTNRQKKLFAESTAKRRLQAIETLSGHEATQRRMSLNAAAIAAAETQRSVAAANAFNEKTVSEARAEGLKRLGVAAQINGMGEEEKARAQEKYLTGFHVDVIKARIDADPASARRYFDSYKGEIDGTVHDDVEDLFKIAEREHKAAVAAQSEAAQKRAKDAAWQSWRDSKETKMPDLTLRRAMDGKARDDLEREVADVQAGKRVNTDWAQYDRIRNAAVNDPKFDITKEYKYLSLEHRNQIAALHDAAVKESREDVVSFEQQLAEVHARMKWTGSDSSEKRGAFDSAASTEVLAEQKRLGKKLSQDERKKIIDGLLIRGSIKRDWASDPSGRAYELQSQPDASRFTPDDPADYARMVIPAVEREQILAALKKHNSPATEENIRAAFVANHQTPSERD